LGQTHVNRYVLTPPLCYAHSAALRRIHIIKSGLDLSGTFFIFTIMSGCPFHLFAYVVLPQAQGEQYNAMVVYVLAGFFVCDSCHIRPQGIANG